MSLTPLSYFTIREHMAADLRRGLVDANPEALCERVRICALKNRAEAAEFTERFLADIARGLNTLRR